MPAVSHVYVGVKEFQDRVSELTRRVSREYLCVHISRHGRPMAVLVSERDAKARAAGKGGVR